MASFRVRLAAQDKALKALQHAANAEPDKAIAAEMMAIARQMAKRFGVTEPAP